jgi:hypothetical protein
MSIGTDTGKTPFFRMLFIKVERMKTSRMGYRSQTCLLLAAWLLAAGSYASAQVMKQVPANSLLVLKVSNLQQTSKKVADFCTQMGITQMDPDMQDPLGSFLKAIGVNDGVNREGELAFIYFEPSTFHTNSDKSLLLLIPVSDYQKFLGNFPDSKPDGDLTQVHFNKDPDVTYVARWGDFAAASPTRDIVATAPTEIIQVTGLAAKELDGKDVVLLANLKAIREKAIQQVQSARKELAGDIDKLANEIMRSQHFDATKFKPLANLIANESLDMAQKILEGMDAASFSVNLSPDGVATTLMAQFESGSSCDKYIAKVKNTDDSMLQGLAAGKYLLFGGTGGQQELNDSVSNFIAPIQKQITDLGPDYASLNDWLNSAQKATTAAQGSSFGLMMPTAQPGAGALIQVVGIRRGDAKTMLDGMRGMADAQQAILKAFNVQLPGQTQTYTRDSKTVDGISFDEMKSTINLNGQNPGQMQAMQMITMMYGPQGPDAFTGIVDDHTMLTVMGLDDTAISAAIAAAKAGDDPLAKTSSVKAVSSQLPAQRIAVMYTPLDLWATTGFGYAKMFGIDMGVTLPENLPPMGTTLSTEGSAIRCDTYIPSQLIQALTSAGMQVYMKTQNPPPNQGGQPGGGGL